MKWNSFIRIFTLGILFTAVGFANSIYFNVDYELAIANRKIKFPKINLDSFHDRYSFTPQVKTPLEKRRVDEPKPSLLISPTQYCGAISKYFWSHSVTPTNGTVVALSESSTTTGSKYTHITKGNL